MKYEVIQGESLEAMRGMADDSFSLIVADPPYFKVKDEDWDNQWKTKGDYLKWIGLLCQEWKRLLKPNGSLYVFASPEMSAHVEVKISEVFNVLNSIRWIKEAGWHNKTDKEAIRGYLSPHEAIIFAEQYGADNMAKGEAGYEAKCDELRGFIFEPLRAYLDGERMAAMLTPEDCNEICGHRREGGMAGRHYFSASQWCLPTAENYSKLQTATGRFTRPYESLRAEYEELRRPFNATPDAPYTDVWTFPTVSNYKGKHPCEKPLEMLRHIVKVSSREGDSVLDSFAGSFKLGEAALSLNRSYVGIDGSAHWCERGRKNLSAFGKQGTITLQSVVEFKRASVRPRVERELPLFNVA